MEVMQSSKVKEQLDIIWRPHPVAPSADCQYKEQEWKSGQTVREVLIANGIDQYQPISIVLDDRLLTVEEWDTVCPLPNQIINVKAEVAGGGGGGSQVLQVVAMIALVVAIVVLQQYELLPLIGGLSAGASAGIYMAVGSLIINGIAAMVQSNSMSMGDVGGMGGAYSQASPTYSLTGGSNRLRPYESMPVIMGTHRFFPDAAIKPYTEYIGEDQYLRQVFHLGLSGATFSNWEIGTTPITSYSDYTWAYPDSNGKINAFPGNVDTIAGAALEKSAGWITRTTSLNTDSIGIDIEGTLYYANDAGGLDGTSVYIEIEYKATSSGTWLQPTRLTAQGNGFAVGDYQEYQQLVESGYWGHDWQPDEFEGWGYVSSWIDTSYYETRTRWVAGSGNMLQLSGASQSPRRTTVFLDVVPGEYDVRVRRVTDDSTNSRLQNKTNWSALKSYQTDTASYVGQNRIGISIRASEQLSGVIQQMSVTASAKANYYNGSAWVYAATSNPAHWFMDFVVGRKDKNGKLVYGVGLPTSQIDYVGLASWASFCATEGLTFNSVLDGNQTAADILNGIARAGFASPSWASGKLGAVWDKRNASPVAAFGMSNIIKGSFQVSYITEQLAEEIVVRYINPAKDWTQDEVRVDVPGVTNPTRTSTMDLWGCTSKTMAGKFANYIAAQQYYRTRRITWDCDFEGFVCQRGDVVILSHDLTQWGYSGRVVSVSGNVITLDRKVPRNGAIEYVMLKDPDGSMATYSVSAETGEDNTLTLTSTPVFQGGYLPLDHMWFFSPLATPGKKVKILSVQPTSDSRVQIVATDEYPEFYAAWDGTWREPADSSLLKKPQVPVIANLRFTEQLALLGTGRIVTRVNIAWDQKTSQCEKVDVTYRLNGGAPKTITVYGAKDIDVDLDGYGTVTATALPINGIYLGAAISGTGYVYGKTIPPTTPTGLNATVSGARVLLDWANNPELDLAGYEVRTSNSGWGGSGFVFKGSASQCFVAAPLVGSFGTWYVKAYDTSGLYSNTAVSVSFTPSAVTNISGVTHSFYDTSATSATITLDWNDVTPQFGLGSYEITYGSVIKTAKASTIILPADWVGDRSFVIKTIDANGNKSTGYTKTVTKLLPNAPASGTSRVDNGALSLDWTDSVKTTLPVWGYEVRRNTSFGTSGFVFKGATSSCTVDVPSLTLGANAFYIKAIDTDGNYSSTYLTINHQYYTVYDTTAITYIFADTSLTNATITLDWPDVKPQYGLAYYEVSDTVATKNVNASTITLPANWIGSRNFTVKTVDANGFKSSGFTISVTKLVPNSPINFRASVIDNTVMLYWTLPAKTTLPIAHALLKKGATWATATSIGEKAGEFTVVNESTGGIFTYWLAMVDTDGYQSTPVQITAKVSEPPDFVFHGSQNSIFSGTKSSALLEQGKLIIPVNLTETWQDHFSTRGWSTPQDQINAGYPIYIQPGATTGYYRETFDFGTILNSSKITLSYGYNTLDGTPNIVTKIETSDDNSTWVVNDAVTEVFATNFRYVRVTVTVTGADDVVISLNSLNVRCDAKQKTDAGQVSAVSTDASGTIVNFNKEFIDIDAITCTPSGTTPLTPVYDFQDAVLSGTYSVTSNVITVNVTGHGLIAGQKVRLGVSTGTAPSTVVTIATAATNSFTAALTTGNTSGNLSIYPEGFRVYLFNSAGTRVSGTVSWNVRGY